MLRFKGCPKSYKHGTARMLLRRGLLSWLKFSKPEAFFALRGVSFDLGQAKPGDRGGQWRGQKHAAALRHRHHVSRTGQIHARGTIAALMELGAGFHPDLTGAENVVLNASLLGLTRKQTSAQFDRSLSFRGWPTLSTSRCGPIPPGWCLRLAFSVAVRVDPDILVIDEILAVGDIDFQQKCVAEINRLKQDGKTLICVAHDLRLLRELCEQALWLEHGESGCSGRRTRC